MVPTVVSIQRCGYRDFEAFILDQSGNDSTEQAILPLCAEDARLKYVRLNQPNKPRALNRGRELAIGRYVLLTDDDCEVKPGWIEEMVRFFETNAGIGCVFGDVDAGPFDPADGYVPACRITAAHAIFSLSQFLTMPGWGNFGMGANMAMRSDVLAQIGGWDACIGPGAYFRSGDDHDVAARVLAAGYGLGFCPSARAVHFGLRRWDKVGADQSRYGCGMGAAFAKHLRSGSYHPGPLRLLGDNLQNAVGRLWHRERPFGFSYPRGWVHGFLDGLMYPLDPRTRCFVPRNDPREEGASGPNYTRVADVVLRSVQAEAKSQKPPAG